jgi:hypothetical protein
MKSGFSLRLTHEMTAIGEGGRRTSIHDVEQLINEAWPVSRSSGPRLHDSLRSSIANLNAGGGAFDFRISTRNTGPAIPRRKYA